MNGIYERIYELVRRVPVGRVTTYGQLGVMCGLTDMRAVGEAMNASTGIPWQRVINSRGEISIRGGTGARQRALLEAEGVEFDETGRVDLARFGWQPEPEWLAQHGYRVPPPFKPARDTEKPQEPDGQLPLF